ncbi:MAG: hypothetical protein V3W37_02450, partial [Candidatus Binatia bacterium]
MCEYVADTKSIEVGHYPSLRAFDISSLMSYAEFLADEDGLRRTAVGFIGYSGAGKGDKVLIAIDSHYDPRIAESIAAALRQKGCKVD